MYRFLLSPRWLFFHLIVVAGIVLMVNLGFWQLRRLDERQALNEAVSSRIVVPPQPLDDVVVDGVDPASVEWRSVTATGTYETDGQFVVVNRSQNGVPGEMVVTPLELDDGRVLLVERGFQPLDTESPAAPSGTVEIVGRLRPSARRYTGQLSDAAEGVLTEAQRVDIPRLQAQLDGPAVPMYVELVTSTPAEATPYPQPVLLPELTEGPHLSYAVQWFIFSAAVVVGWVLAVRKSLSTRRAKAARAADDASAEAVGASPPSVTG